MTPDRPESNPSAEKDAIHWGSKVARPTSLHGNGASALGRTTLNWDDVTCRLCLSLRGSDDVPCPDKACSATSTGDCRYPGWQMCMHPATPPAITSWHCRECGHCHTPDGCVGDPTPSDLWAGVSPAACDCDAVYPPAKPWCLCDPGFGPHDADCPVVTRPAPSGGGDDA